MLTEKYRPKTKKELVGNKRAIDIVERCIESGKPCLLHGEPGVGKTSTVYALANDLGYAVQEINASDHRKRDDMEQLLARVRTKGFRKHLYLLDEVDGMSDWVGVRKIITYSVNPIMLIANDAWKIPKKIRDLCTEAKFYTPRPRQVLDRLKKIAEQEGREVDYSKTGEDVRSSINAVFYGGDTRKSENRFNIIDNVLRGRSSVDKLEEDDLIWILDNIHNYYSGANIVKAFNILALASRTKNLDILQHLPKGSGKVEYPRYFRKVKVARRQKGRD